MTFLFLAEALANAPVQRQVDPETGITTYSFRPSHYARIEKQVPRPMPQSAPTPPALPPATSTAKSVETRIAPPIGLISSSRRDFPRVSAEVQKERDSERRRILKNELVWEEENLAQAIERKASDDVVIRYRSNIEALNREIRNTQ